MLHVRRTRDGAWKVPIFGMNRLTRRQHRWHFRGMILRCTNQAGGTLFCCGTCPSRRSKIPTPLALPLLRRQIGAVRRMPALPASAIGLECRPMFEAHFQTFDDASERAESAGRVAALRAELARRGLDGLVVPRADRQQNEYLPASEERLAWLTGFTGSAGAAIVLADKAAIFVDGRYTVQADAQVDSAVFAIEHLVETPPAQWLEANLTAGRQGRLRSLAAYHRRRRPPAQGLRQCRRRTGGASTTTRSTRCGPTGRRRRRRRSNCTTSSSPAKAPPTNCAASRPRSPRRAPTCWWCRTRRTSPGPSTSAAATSRTRRWRSPSRSCRARASRRSMSMPAKLDNAARAALADIADVRSADDLERDLAQLERQDRAARPGHRGRRADAARARARRQAVARRRSDHAHEGGEEPHRDRGHARRAQARRRGAGALPRLVRARGADRQAHRDRRGGGAGKLPPRHRPLEGRVVSDHRRRRAERGNRALPRHARVEPQDRHERTVPASIPARNTRTAPPTSPAPSRSARRRTRCATASRACSKAISPSPPPNFPKASAARSSIRWRALRCGRPGSTSTTAPATASAAISRCTRGRRASPSSAPWRSRRGMILSNEPGYYKTAAYGIRTENLVLVIAAPEPEGAEKPLNAFETLTLAPIDRTLIDTPHADGEGAALARQLSRAGVARRSARWSTTTRAVAGEGDKAALSFRLSVRRERSEPCRVRVPSRFKSQTAPVIPGWRLDTAPPPVFFGGRQVRP